MSMANDPTYQIVQAMLHRGNQPGLLREWFDGLKAWAETHKGPDANALALWLDVAKPRPFYTAAELAAMWPAFKLALGFAKIMTEPPSANRLANELKFHRLPVCWTDDGKEYFIVERCHHWRGKTLTQEEFENAVHY